MTMTDPIADMLTRIRNANVAMHDDVTMPSSKLKESLAAVLQKEGYIQAFRVDQEEGKPSKTLTIDMKYSEARERVITGIRRVSKPGLRVYTKADVGPPCPRGPGCRRRLDQQGSAHRSRGSSPAHRWRDPLLRLVGGDMSRVGQAPIPVPSGVDVKIEGRVVTVKGPKGELSRTLPDRLSITLDEGELTVARADEERESRALHGLFRSLVANMVTGVTEGYRRGLEIVGVGYRATAQGDRALELAVGYSHTVKVQAPEGITFEVPSNTRIDVVGIDKETVGQVAADIRAIRKPEPYKGKGIRYQGEVVRRKAGKAASAG